MAAGKSKGRVNILIGVLLVGLGAMFLLGQVFDVNLAQFLWPFFIIVPGLLFFVGMIMGGKPAGPLAIPGSIVTMTGLLLLYQSITGHWESWAYAWALIMPTSIGVGLVINGSWNDLDRLVNTGMRWITTGLFIFLGGGIFFEMFIFRNFLGSVVLPVVLIGVGIYLLARRGKAQRVAREHPAQPVEPDTRPIVEEAQRPETEFEPLNMSRE